MKKNPFYYKQKTIQQPAFALFPKPLKSAENDGTHGSAVFKLYNHLIRPFRPIVRQAAARGH